jgi:AmmeMemoRadiSam system protein A
MNKPESSDSRETGVDLGLSAEEKAKLRELAFHAIRCRCLGEAMPDIAVDAQRLKEPGAAFVCIHKGKDLRGCIGMIEARAPLWETVKAMAVQAAFGDPRFCALAGHELDQIDIEISVLTPMRRIGDPSEIEIGKHGLFIRRGARSGLLLPQVATEHNWDREQFLEWTCHKAGVPGKAWKDNDVELYVFSADVF